MARPPIVRTRMGTQHAADIDTTGMSASIPELLHNILAGEVKSPQPNAHPSWFQSLGRHINMMFHPQQGRPPAPHPPAAPVLTKDQADSIYNKYVAPK